MEEPKEQNEPKEELKPTITRSASDVMILSNPINGNYIVKTKQGEFYVVSTNELEFSVLWQEYPSSKLKERPYDFSEELKGKFFKRRGSPAKQADVLEALYRSSVVDKASFKDYRRHLANRGIQVEEKK